MNRIELHPTDLVRRLTAIAFPTYRGRKFHAVVTDQPITLRSHWDGGSRDRFVILRADGARARVPQTGTMFDGPLSTPPSYAPTPETIIIEHSIFQGKDLGITIYLHPDLAPKYLPAPASGTLTADEEWVLLASIALKSHYAGRPVRRDFCATKGIASDAYDTAVASLQQKGYLNRVGAVTVEGRNVANRLPNRNKVF